MCGIVGCIAGEDVNEILYNGIRKLEYRGYDSCGIAVTDGKDVVLKKDVGDIEKVNKKIDLHGMKGNIGMAHTRWATTGKVTKENAHPHADDKEKVFLVHNGIIENYEEIKKGLLDSGHVFKSETDSEVIAHFIAERIGQGKTPEEAMKDFINTARGTFAVLFFVKGLDRLYAMKRDSPLCLGLIDGKHMLASDIYAFSDVTNKAIFFDDEEYAVIDRQGYRFFDCFGDPLEKEISTFKWTRKEESKEKFDHFMMKEIKEQPEVVGRLVDSFETFQKAKIKEIVRLIKNSRRVVFLACGTSYHASLVGAFLLTQLGIRAHSVIASEFEHFLLVDKDTLVIPISQSGETMDVVTVLKDIKFKKAKIASIVNVPYSTVQRLSDVSVEILAGQEICVAATKSFTNQLVTLFEIARELGNRGINLASIPDKIRSTIDRNEEYIKALAKELYETNDIFVLGRGMSYPIAREFALKLKEISYIHAEGMMAGELKHGTIALVEEGTPIISLIPNNNPDMISNTKEVEARGARTIVISNTNGEIHLPSSTDAEFAVYSALIGHLLSYYIAKLRKLPIDKPRNLAKSVTVK